MEQNSLRLEDTTNIDIGTLWLAFSKAKTVIQHAQRLENLSWRSWQQEMQTHKKPSLNLILLIVNEIQPDQVHKTSIKQTDKKLQPPPTIISIAPTPPSASPAITAPTSPISVPVLPSPIPEQQPSHLLLSPHPQSYQQQQLTPSSNSNSPTDNPFDHPSKPAQPHIGRSTSPILRSNPQSTQSQSSHHPRRSLQDDKAHHDHPKNNLHHIPRRATSSVDFKRKRRPISTTPRPHSHQSTSHSVTPHLAPTPTPPQSLWIKDQNQPTTSSFSSPEQSQDFSKPLDLTQSTNLTVPSQTQTHSNPSSTTSHNQHSKDQHPHSHDVDSQTTPSAGYNSSGSLPSVVSPIIPVTPNNSQVTAPFQIAQDIIPDSLASSHTTGRSSAFMPSAPPPTPSQNGAPLPTTMSAALKNKPQLAQHQGPLLPSTLSPINTTTGGGKKKAKFFIKEYEADDDKTFSPTSFTAQPTQSIQAFTQMTINPTQHTSPPGPVMTISPEKQEPKNAQVSIERQEELEGTDSDEWGSEYSDDEGNEAEELAERAKAQELEKKRKQEEYHRQLFAKKHFVQRNLSHDGRQEPPPIRRAGLSMLFHPELNHLQHHPTSGSGGAGDGGGPLRNQSAVELRRHGSASLSSRKPGDQEPAPGPRSSIGSIPRPSSLIKSKSSVAVPVLAGQDPPVMVQRSPSSHSGQSSLLRQSHRPPTRRNSAAPNGGAAGTTTPGPLPPTRSLPHPAHQRHPSRLGGKPENVEYSDDDSSSEGSQTGQRPGQSHAGAQMTEEQERRLGRLAGGARTGPITLGGGGGAGSNGRPEPIAPPLSPRTTRRNMLANEMTESVRRNLLWERHMRAQALGIALPALPDHRVELPTLPHLDHPASTNLPFTHASNTAVFPPTSTNTTTTTTTTTQFKKNIANGNKEYRNFSKGFHRTGW